MVDEDWAEVLKLEEDETLFRAKLQQEWGVDHLQQLALDNDLSEDDQKLLRERLTHESEFLLLIYRELKRRGLNWDNESNPNTQ